MKTQRTAGSILIAMYLFIAVCYVIITSLFI